MEYVFWTKKGNVDVKRLVSYVEVVKEEEGSDDVEVRFLSDNTTATVKRDELFNPDVVPFKVGDKVKNRYHFDTALGSKAWPGINWEVKMVTYSTSNFDTAMLVCDSYEVFLFNKMFLSNEVEKI